jgi:hypothetical protein
MPVTLDQVLQKVAASDTTADRDRLRRTVMDTILALGHEVAPNGEVYNPAEGSYRPPANRVVARNENGFRFRKRY